MDTGPWIRIALGLVVSVCVCVISGSPIGTSVINCGSSSSKHLGPVTEGYSGDVEVFNGIAAGQGVQLVDHIFAEHLEYLELVFTLGDTSATVRTKKPLDSDALAYTDSKLYYAVVCEGDLTQKNIRTLTINDINDNSPVFTQKLYETNVSEILKVDSVVINVKAVDLDSTVEHNRITYSLEPATEDFFVTSSGNFNLKKPFNYNVVPKYSFTVTARDNGGLNDTATVVIRIEDFDNLNPYFSHSLYQASIPENDVGALPVIHPEAIKAQDGDSGINMTVIYSISAVSPNQYEGNFNIDPNSGVLSVVTAIDREEMNSSMISVNIEAAQTDDRLKTAASVVFVTVDDVNDNPPVFDPSNYLVTLKENSPVDAVVFKAAVTDLDQGGFIGTLQIIPETAPFSVGSDGTIRVKNSTALDRETTETITFQIIATEGSPPNNVATAQVTLTLLDENDNTPAFTSSNYEGKVFANQTVGMFLVQVTAEDPDAGVNSQLTYSIDLGNNEGYFSVDENTGEISLAKTIPLVENRILEFPLFVTARDGGTISRSATTQVNIHAPGNSKPQFLQKVYQGTVEEEQEPGAGILTVNFLAIDAEVPVTLRVETEADKFAISPTGELTSKVKLDYDDAPHNYSVQISISDGVLSDSAVVEVQVTDINDNSPVFTPSSVTKSVPEDADVGTNVTAVLATDKDSGFNKEIRYFLRAGEGKFSIDPVSGMVSVASALDRETTAEYNLLVVAEDQGRPARSATANLLVQVSDVNDNVPKFPEVEYQVEVLETESVNTSLLILSAVDPDEGVNGRLSYSIIQQSPSSDPAVFELDSSSGNLRLVQTLDYSEVNVYTLKVQASDGGTPSLVGNVSVVVKVKDVNNNPPVFSNANYDMSVSENLANGASILTLEVTDRDEGGFIGTLQIIPETAPFSVESDGTIRVKNSTALDRETTETITFQIIATESSPPNNVATAQVTLTLLDENDNTPAFTSSNYEQTVFPNQTVGMFLVQVTAEDPDAGVNGQITYSIDLGNNEGYFSVDENTGEISLVKTIPLLEDRNLDFPVFVTARDGGTISRSATTQVNIHAPSYTKPQFSQEVYQGTVEEEQEPGAVILTVNFLPVDAEVPVTLRVETEADKFAISPTGELTSKVKLDYDDAPHNYSVQISISDGVLSDSAVVEVQVTDINDNSPVFTPSSVTKSVPEDADVGTNVTAVLATDKDSGFNKEIRYFLRAGEGKFSIDPVSGMVSVASALDRETTAEYNLLVVAEDQGRPARSATATLLVQISDVNDNVPMFPEVEYQVEVLETESVNTSLLILSAVDPDEGVNGRLSYSIIQQSPSSDPAVFELDSSSGNLRLVQTLDYSEVNVYTLKVQASDGGTPSLVGNVSVVVKVKDVNNNPPVFSNANYDMSVSENLANGASILTLEVTDRDEGGFIGTLQIIPETAPFSVGSDGTIRVKNSTALDRETTETITFQIKATESSPPNNVATAQVTLTLLDENDNTPAFTSSNYGVKVFANQTVGMFLVQVTAEDPDVGVNGQITYSIDLGNNEGYFSVDENTGEISLAKTIPLVENRILEFTLFVTARDGGTISRSATTQVNIHAPGNSKPQFLQKVYQGTVEEEQEPGAVILTVNFLAIDAEVPVTLRVETEADKFAISPTGELTSKVKLDYDDAPHNYSVQISISDGVLSDSAVVEVQVTDINDNSPVFTPSSVTKSVPEDADVGTNVTAVLATDKDSGFNKEIRYFLRAGEGKFSIDPVSGMVSVASALDRETTAEYNLLVVAEDQGRPARSATATLLVQVSDVNDNVPMFPEVEYQVEVLETESVNTSLLILSAVDPDEGVNGRLSYSIIQQSPSSDPAVFELDSSSGNLRLVQTLDYSEVNVYTLKVQASDGGTPSLVGNVSVVVKVKDVNNNPPVFSKANYDMSVSENLASGTSILTLEVTDRDEGGFSSGYFLYTSDTFNISKQGVVSLRKDVTLDRETTDSYVFQVVAVDQETDGLRATAQVNITVMDYNDNAPQFPSIPDPLTVPEGDYSEETPGEVFTIVPTDPDLGANGEVVLSLLTQSPLFRFREDGMLLAVGPLDRESRETYDLVVKASDKGSPQRESVTAIRVRLTDANDNQPEFSSSSYFSSILVKDAEEGQLLLTLSATDRDVGDNSLISYSFSAGSSPYLALDGETGAVTLTSDLSDVKEDTTLELTATAKDHGEPPLSSTAAVVVNLRMASLLENVAFQTSSYSFSLPENQPAGAAVGSVRASSGSSIYDVTYKLNTHSDLFSISATGAITTRKELDKEQQEWYMLDVEAVDTRTPPTSAVAVVRVQVQDVNESPQFSTDDYKVTVFSIAPYKTPLVHVKASDPDVGDGARLVYSLIEGDSSYFDVDPSSGLVYVVSVAGLAGRTENVKVKATDPGGLYAEATVEVTVKGSASMGNVVTLFLNKPVNAVEKKVEELERALGKVLGWTVNIIKVSDASGGATEARAPRQTVRTLISFIALDGDDVVPSEEVIEKLLRESSDVNAELSQVFGGNLQFEVETDPQTSDFNWAVVIALSVLLALSILGLIIAIVLVVRLKRKQKHQDDSDKGSFDLDRHSESYVVWSREDSQPSKQEQMDEKEPEDKQRMDEAVKTDISYVSSL